MALNESRAAACCVCDRGTYWVKLLSLLVLAFCVEAAEVIIKPVYEMIHQNYRLKLRGNELV